MTTRLLAWAVILPLVLPCTADAQDIELNGVKASFEHVTMKVLDIVEISEDGFVYTGYRVEYKGKNLLVSAPPMMDLDAKVGDDITVMVQKMDMQNPFGDGHVKSLQFMVMPDVAKIMKDAKPAAADGAAKAGVDAGPGK